MTAGGINAVCFANNHNIDYGIQAYVDTLDTCDRFHLPVSHYDHVIRQEIHGLTVGIVSADFTLCADSVGEGYLRKGIADLRRDCNLIIAYIHWGANYKENVVPVQKRLGHLCVDLGADLVLGAHPHVLQGAERYKGRYIFYSLGNFCYGGRSAPKDNDTMIVQATFSFKNGKLIQDADVKAIPCWMSGSGTVNDFSPVIKTGREGDAIIDKINSRSADFNIRFGYDGFPIIDKVDLPEIDVSSDIFDERVPGVIYSLIRGKH